MTKILFVMVLLLSIQGFSAGKKESKARQPNQISSSDSCSTAQNVDACYADQIAAISKKIGGQPNPQVPDECDSAPNPDACFAKKIDDIAAAMKARALTPR